MKNFTSSFSGDHHFRLNAAKFVSLKNIWNNRLLSGHYWRFYWNNMSGAGLRINGQKMKLKPDYFYIIPPECGLYTWCTEEDPPYQFYVHFEMTRLHKKSSLQFRELPIRENEKILLLKIIESLQNTSLQETPYLQLQIIALVSNVLTQMEADDFEALHSDTEIEKICSAIRESPE